MIGSGQVTMQICGRKVALQTMNNKTGDNYCITHTFSGSDITSLIPFLHLGGIY